MYIKKITYTDYDGNERTEEFLFNLTKAEIVEMELGTSGGMKKKLEKIVEEKDPTKLIEMFKEIVLKSYGVKSDDGRRFMKSKELVDEFVQTEAYSMLFMELVGNTESASEFINNIIPKDLEKEVKKQEKKLLKTT